MTFEQPIDHPPAPMPVQLPPSSALHRWAQELRMLLRSQPSADAQDWQLQGHAVLLETKFLEEVPALLEQVAGITGMPLHIFSPAGTVEDFLLWIKAQSDGEPALVYLTPGDWMNPSRPEADPEESACAASPCTDAFLCAVQDVMQGLGARPVVLVTAAPGFERLSPCLRQVGYFDRRIRVPEWTADALVSDFLHDIGADLIDESVRAKPERLGALLRAAFPDQRRRSLTVLALKRLARREQRRISFADLVQMATQGTTEDDPMATDAKARFRTAVHEAGHALVSHLDSSTMTAPTLCTAIKSRNCQGRLVTAFEAPETRGDDLTIANMRHKVRVQLAGLAAEHLLLGVEAASAMGSGSDLDEATSFAMHMFADWGIALDTSTPALQASNLATVINGCNPAESPRIVRMARQYLQSEFMKATDILHKHRTYLDSIITALCQQDVLTQEDFEKLWSQQSVSSRHGLEERTRAIEALAHSCSLADKEQSTISFPAEILLYGMSTGPLHEQKEIQNTR